MNSPYPPPAPSGQRSLLGWLRDTFGGWLGPLLGRGSPAEVALETERVRSGPRGVQLPYFLPYFDDRTGETPQHRAAYRYMLADPIVKSALLGKILGVAALNLKVQPADKKNARDVTIADHVRWALTQRVQDGVVGLVWSILSGALVDGYAICEKVWQVEDSGPYTGKIALSALRAKPVDDDVVLVVDDRRRVVGVQGMRHNAGEHFDPAHFVIYAHLPWYSNPAGMSDLRAVYGRYWLLDTAWKLRARGIEGRAVPTVVGTYRTRSDKPSLDEALALLRSRTWLSLPEGAKVEPLNLAGSADAIFADAVRDLKEEIYLGIQGATLQALTGGPGQQRGSSKVHQSTADLLKWHLAACIEALLNDRDNGLVKDIVDLNFAVGDYPRVTLSAVDPDELKAELEIDKGLNGLGLKLSKDELYERYGRTPPADDDDALAPPGGPPGPPGPSPGPPGGAPPALPFAGGDAVAPFLQGVQRFHETVERFCQTGQNAGKPGPCPGTDGAGTDTDTDTDTDADDTDKAAARAAWAAHRQAVKEHAAQKEAWQQREAAHQQALQEHAARGQAREAAAEALRDVLHGDTALTARAAADALNPYAALQQIADPIAQSRARAAAQAAPDFADKAKEHGAALAAVLERGVGARLKAAAPHLPEPAQAKIAATLAKAQASVGRAAARHAAAADAVATARARLAEIPDRPEPEEPEEPDEEGSPEHKDWQKAHKAWEKDTAAWEKEQGRREALSDKLDEVMEKLDDALGDLEEAVDDADTKVNDVIDAALEKEIDRLDTEAERDEEPEPTHGDEPEAPEAPDEDDPDAAAPHAESAARKRRPWQRFCQEGENKGKPGPCPGPEQGVGAERAPAQPQPAPAPGTGRTDAEEERARVWVPLDALDRGHDATPALIEALDSWASSAGAAPLADDDAQLAVKFLAAAPTASLEGHYAELMLLAGEDNQAGAIVRAALERRPPPPSRSFVPDDPQALATLYHIDKEDLDNPAVRALSKLVPRVEGVALAGGVLSLPPEVAENLAQHNVYPTHLADNDGLQHLFDVSQAPTQIAVTDVPREARNQDARDPQAGQTSGFNLRSVPQYKRIGKGAWLKIAPEVKRGRRWVSTVEIVGRDEVPELTGLPSFLVHDRYPDPAKAEPAKDEDDIADRAAARRAEKQERTEERATQRDERRAEQYETQRAEIGAASAQRVERAVAALRKAAGANPPLREAIDELASAAQDLQDGHDDHDTATQALDEVRAQALSLARQAGLEQGQASVARQARQLAALARRRLATHTAHEQRWSAHAEPAPHAELAARKRRPWQRFCQEGENKGKPGPCPEPEQGGATSASAGPKGRQARAVAPLTPDEVTAALSYLSQRESAIREHRRQALETGNTSALREAAFAQEMLRVKERETFDRLPGPVIDTPPTLDGKRTRYRLLPNGRLASADLAEDGTTYSIDLTRGSTMAGVRREHFPAGIPGIDPPEEIAARQAEQKKFNVQLAFAMPEDPADFGQVLASPAAAFWDGKDADGNVVAKPAGTFTPHPDDLEEGINSGISLWRPARGETPESLQAFLASEFGKAGRTLPINSPKVLARIYPLLTGAAEKAPAAGDEQGFAYKPINDQWAITATQESDTEVRHRIQPLDKVRQKAERLKRLEARELAALDDDAATAHAEPTPPTQQRPWTCGPAALRGAARRLGLDVPEADLAAAAGTSPEDGTPPPGLIAAAQGLGLSATLHEGLSRAQVQRCLIQGRPVLLCLQAHGPTDGLGSGHWVALVGGDARHARLLDPAATDGTTAYPWAELERRWVDQDADGRVWRRCGIVLAHGADKFCQEGVNKGKPGPCPAGGGGGKWTATMHTGAGREDAGSVYKHGTGAVFGAAKYYAFDPKTAAQYGPDVTQHDVELHSPLHLSSDGDWLALTKAAGVDSKLGLGTMDKQYIADQMAKLTEYVKAQGHDGVVVRTETPLVARPGFLKPRPGMMQQHRELQRIFGHSQVVVFPSTAPPEDKQGVLPRPV